MEPEPRWFALVAALLVAAIAFPLVTGEPVRGFPPAVLALAIAFLMLRDRRRGPESVPNHVRDRRAVAIFIGIAVVTALAAITVTVLDAL